jgi:hypothetical protein
MLIFWPIWAAFVAYAFLLAPANSPNTLSLILNLSTGQWAGINPIVIALFNLMGIWPMAYGAVMLFEQSEKSKPGWFCGASFAVGAFAILPYLALRKPQPESALPTKPLLKILDSRWLAIALLIISSILLTYGITQGDWAAFVQQWRSERFIHVMSLDFVMLWLLFAVLAKDDAQRRGAKGNLLAVCLMPLLGALFYLLFRPQLLARTAEAPRTLPDR